MIADEVLHYVDEELGCYVDEETYVDEFWACDADESQDDESAMLWFPRASNEEIAGRVEMTRPTATVTSENFDKDSLGQTGSSLSAKNGQQPEKADPGR